MNKFILLILVMLISGVAAVKTDAKALETALGVMVLIEKVKQFCGKKPEGAIAITLPFGLLTQLYLRYSCVSRPSASDQKIRCWLLLLALFYLNSFKQEVATLFPKITLTLLSRQPASAV